MMFDKQYIMHSVSDKVNKNVYICLFLTLPSHHLLFLFSPSSDQEKVADFSEAAGNAKFMPPLAVVIANTTIIQTCPERLECLLTCPSASVSTFVF